MSALKSRHGDWYFSLVQSVSPASLASGQDKMWAKVYLQESTTINWRPLYPCIIFLYFYFIYSTKLKDFS